MTNGSDSERGIAAIDKLIDAQARALIHAFYDNEEARQSAPQAHFVGELFVTLGPSDPDRFEAADLVAVHLMGMSFLPTTVRALLESEQEQEEVSGLLARIPKVDIWADEADFEAADQLWRLLAKDRKKIYPGINRVTAGKLLARKRPTLIPVIDKVITTLVPEPPDGYWRLFQTYLRDPARLRKVEELRPPGIGAKSSPTLRLLDTAIWMRGSRGPAREVRMSLGVPD